MIILELLALVKYWPYALALFVLVVGLALRAGRRRRQPVDTRPILLCGNTHTLVYHFPECPHAQRIPRNQRIGFHDQDEALDRGYHACQYCKPPVVRVPK